MDGDQMNNPMNPLCDQFIAGEDPLLGSIAGIQQPPTGIRHMDWSPATMLDNLTFIEEKIRQVKDVIRAMAGDDDGDAGGSAQQQVVNADLTCLIVQLISTAGSLLPSLKNSSFLTRPVAGAGGGVQPTANLAAGESSCSGPSNAAAVFEDESKQEQAMGSPDYEALFNGLTDGAEAAVVDDCSVLAAADDPPPEASEVILQLEEDEILAPHTHFCGVCGKGFKRDANLRMHMRGHGDEYKSAAALARPPRDAASVAADERLRYSCPFAGCKRNREHAAFQPLKTLMCVKNHYKRSHCEKRHVCGVCGAKRFSVVADLKTHEKHCGRHRWLCSCGTSFSRKDKLFAHVALFQHGHSPALPPSSPTPVQPAPEAEETPGGFVWGSSSGGVALADIKAIGGDDDFLSTGNFGEQFDFGFGQLDDGAFAQDAYEGSSLAMLLQDGGK